MSEKKQKKTIFILLIAQVLVLFGVFSYAWFASDMDPVIYSEKMMIASSEGLYIQLEDSTGPDVYTELNIKDVAKDFRSFATLNQISSANGKVMYRRVEQDGLISYIETTDETSYVEAEFLLINKTSTTDIKRNIYIKSLDLQFVDKNGNALPMSSFAYDALRFSLEFGGTNSIVYILSLDNNFNRYDAFKEKTIENDGGDIVITDGDPYSTDIIELDVSNNFYILKNAVYRDGISETESNEAAIDKAINSGTISNVNIIRPCLGSQIVYFASYFKSSTDQTRSLYTIGNGQNVKVCFRMWLEGADPRCTTQVSSTKINMKLVFGSYPVNPA